MISKKLAITWQLSDTHGWGVFGTHLALELIKNGPCPPLLLELPRMRDPDSEALKTLLPFAVEGDSLMFEVRKLNDFKPGPTVIVNYLAVLHCLGNEITHGPVSDLVRGHANIGFIFFESAVMDAAAVERGRQYDRILAGSTWNRDFLLDKGLEDTVFFSQGVDTGLFSPGPAAPADDGRFKVFSGGKLERRKGQDTVLAAFRRFRERHPDSILLTAWRNAWPDTARDIAGSPHVEADLEFSKDEILIEKWAADNGVPADAFVDLGWVPNLNMAEVLRGMDVAVFTNRCEGGTNLVAMEAMACGVPAILSANTGHLDLIEDGNCYPLGDQREINGADEATSVWRESSVDEIVECLEQAYTDRDDAARRGAAGAEFMKNLSWKKQIAKIIGAIEDLL